MEKIELQIEELTKKIGEKPREASNYYKRGRLHWQLGNRAAALTDFNTAVHYDPESPAAIYLKMADDILDFYNRDLYNP